MKPTGTSIEELSDAECLRLLRSARLGRIALVHGEQPLVLPVNYARDGDAVVFGTATGSLLDRAAGTADRDRVAFEIDAADSQYHEGWSVLVVGRIEHITLANELRAPVGRAQAHALDAARGSLTIGRRIRHT